MIHAPPSIPRPPWVHAFLCGLTPLRTALILAIATLLPFGTTTAAAERTPSPTIYGYEIVNTYPHDPSAFCQGLAFVDGALYEGTGQYGQSTLRKVELQTGRCCNS